MNDPSELATVRMEETERLDFEAVRENYANRWHRALKTDFAVLEKGDRPDLFVVRFEDSEDGHAPALARTGGENPDWFGYCPCEGFGYHDGPCAHLCGLRMEHEVASVDVPVAPATALESSTPEAEVVDAGAGEDPDDIRRDQEDPDGAGPDAGEEPDPTDAGSGDGPSTVSADEVVPVDEAAVAEDDVRASAPTPGADIPAPSGLQQGEDPFAQPLEGVDERFVVKLRGEPELRRDRGRRPGRQPRGRDRRGATMSGPSDVGRGIKPRPPDAAGSEEHNDPSDEGEGTSPEEHETPGEHNTRMHETTEDKPTVEQLEQRVAAVEAHNEALSRRQDHFSEELDRLESVLERIKEVLGQ